MVDKVCCIVFKEGINGKEFLILHKNNWWNGWEFVRGELMNNENATNAALREINHETGLNITNVKIVPFNYNYSYMKGLNNVDSNVSCFVAKAKDDLVTLSNEHNYYKWVDFNRAINLLDFNEQKKLLEFIMKR